jgi:hypothetical protein
MFPIFCMSDRPLQSCDLHGTTGSVRMMLHTRVYVDSAGWASFPPGYAYLYRITGPDERQARFLRDPYELEVPVYEPEEMRIAGEFSATFGTEVTAGTFRVP